LYSSSDDRTVKVYNIDELAYVETLFGHQDKITYLDSFGSKERCLSTGGRDRTVRLWKIVEESQLVFRASSGRARTADTREKTWLSSDETGSLDCVSFINDDTWVTGSDGGTLAVWTIMRKKPIHTFPNAHGRVCTFTVDDDETALKSENVVEVTPVEDEQVMYAGNIFQSGKNIHLDWENVDSVTQYLEEKNPKDLVSKANWISALRCFPFSDLVASGSCDGYIRLWKLKTKQKTSGFDENDDTEEMTTPSKFEQIAKIPLCGWINSLAFSKSGRYLVAGVGREPKDGRWMTIKNAKNGIAIIDLSVILDK
jgi:ribosomal RNA-processing protein 9